MAQLPSAASVARRWRSLHTARWLLVLSAAGAISACTSSGVLDLQPPVDVGTQTAAVPSYSVATVAQPPVSNPAPISGPAMAIGYPRVEEPAFGPEPMPADEGGCRKELKRL